MIYPACKYSKHKTCPYQYVGLEPCKCECHKFTEED
jgi:hypothetical protein